MLCSENNVKHILFCATHNLFLFDYAERYANPRDTVTHWNYLRRVARALAAQRAEFREETPITQQART